MEKVKNIVELVNLAAFVKTDRFKTDSWKSTEF